MAVTFNGAGADYRGFSTDNKSAKPAVNSIFLELDTESFYFYDGSTWNLVGGGANE
jgi:hypothetical protein